MKKFEGGKLMKTNKKSGTSKRLSGTQQVEEFLSNLDHDLKEEINEVRKIVLNVNNQIDEHIKWNAPSFSFDGEDRITFNLRGNGFFRLIFHCGSKVKEVDMTPFFNPSTDLLEWITNDRAVVKFNDKNDIKAKESKLKEIVTKWIEVSVK